MQTTQDYDQAAGEAERLVKTNDFEGLKVLMARLGYWTSGTILSSIADHLDPSQAEAFYAAVVDILPLDQRQSALEHLFLNLGSHDLKIAAMLLEKTGTGSLRDGYLQSIASAAATGDLESAYHRVEQLLLTFPDDRALLDQGFGQAMSQRSATDLCSILAKEDAALRQAAIYAGLSKMGMRPDQLDRNLLQALANAGQADTIIKSASATGEPAANAKLVTDLGLQLSDVSATLLYNKWDLKDVQGAVASMAGMDGDSQRRAAGVIFARLTYLDMGEAAAELNRVASGPIRDSGTIQLINSLIERKSFDEAANWADSISDPALKTKAAAKIEKKRNAGAR